MDTGVVMIAVFQGTLGAAVLGGVLLAVFLARHGRAGAEMRPLIGFLLIVSVWTLGLLIPDRRGACLLALAPIGGAVFVHFAARLAGKTTGWVGWAYAAGGAAMVGTLFAGCGSFISWPGTGSLFRYEGMGLAAVGVTIGLAALAHLMLIAARRRAKGVRRAQLTLILLSSSLGLIAVSGLGLPVTGVRVAPWPLLLLPLYLLVLTYGVLRYRLMTVNRWAVRAVIGGMLIVLSGGISALTAGLAAEQAGVPFLTTAFALVIGLGLAGPIGRLADRIIYPGGRVDAADLRRWHAVLLAAPDDGAVEADAARLLREYFHLSADDPGDDLDQAPPGPRRVVALMAAIVAEAKTDLARRRAFADRQRLAELGSLAATIAHDIRNPMNIIAMAVADAAPDLRAEIKVQLGRMDGLVRDLLDFVKPWRMDRVRCVLAEALAAIDPTIETNVPPGLTVLADPGRLRQALVNLIDNARAAGGALLIAARTGPDGVEIDVCDTGPGIPAEIRPVLFQPFVSRTQNGTGLGLAIVAKVMAAHGGSVALVKRPGWSTCFRLRFAP